MDGISKEISFMILLFSLEIPNLVMINFSLYFENSKVTKNDVNVYLQCICFNIGLYTEQNIFVFITLFLMPT